MLENLIKYLEGDTSYEVLLSMESTLDQLKMDLEYVKARFPDQ